MKKKTITFPKMGGRLNLWQSIAVSVSRDFTTTSEPSIDRLQSWSEVQSSGVLGYCPCSL